MSIHPTAVIDPRATVDSTTTIGPHVVIDGPVRIGADCRIAASAVIMGNTVIEAGCRIHAHAVIGDLPQDRAYDGGESYCQVGAGCTIREGVTIHRGTGAGSATVIGRGCLLMTNCHIGHNCVLHDEVTIVSGVLLGGYVQVGARALISGGAAVHQFVRIGELAIISGLGKIVQDVPPFFMTDRDGAIVGENRVGLRRAGFSPMERDDIKLAHRIIYRSGMGRDEAIENLAGRISTAAGRRLLDFLSAGSKRGISREAIPFRRAA
ncbi:MAG: acyl-ACP--UDP-N-acetylglucosamine O-acyltransferase [Planctomycetaceae bacterium]